MEWKNFVRSVISSAFILLSCVEFSSAVSHDLTIGNCANTAWNRSVPIFSQVVHKQNNKFFSMFRKTDVTLRFPRTGELNVPITCVTIQDNEKNGKGGYAMIKEGGINYRHITVEFVSQTGGDIKFTVYLYGDNGPTMQTNVQAHPAAGWVYPQNIPQNVQPNYPYQQPYPYNTRY